ncbi:hypothetical protein [Deinococcus sp. YIM 77859]|uniref:hypothetical protein n=1 Tax=Deinococcus sp. YIM 77859 TaxID=1540221 RepID=UPI00054D5F8B|nr:hypothetical protein [Deinococcus sp. YIM 77859]
MITWFDALLVTVWATVTALGARRGLAGLLWGLGGAAVCFLANLLARGALSAAVLALLLGAVLALILQRLVPSTTDRLWQAAAGALGGFTLGGLLIATLTLGFPLGLQVGPKGRSSVYPSTSLPPVLYVAVHRSVLKSSLMRVWRAHPALQLLLIPDRVEPRR